MSDNVEEFADYGGSIVPSPMSFEPSLLLDPATIRGGVAAIGGIVLLVADRSTRLLAVVIALVLIVSAVGEVLVARAYGWASTRLLLRSIAGITVGVALLVWPQITGRVLSRLVSVAVGVAAGRDASEALRSEGTGAHRLWLAIRSVFELAVALAVFFSPGTVFELVLFLFGMFWVVSGIAAVISNVGTEHHVERVVDVWPRFFEWLASRPYTVNDRQQLYEKLFYEGDVATRRLSRFFLLMLFAATIAALGVVSDSTAVVIGAMLVAPLMTPLMGTALSLAMGWPKRTLMSAGVALGGILLTVGLSAFIGAIIPFDLQFATNAQVVSRVSPTLVDLFIATAAGAAGAFALSRPDVSDALPGVAVAIALVPPLAVFGLLIEARAFEDAFGALTLFTTNAVAILLVGALVFLLTGVAPVARLRENRQQVRNSLTLVGALAIVLVVLLGVTGEEIQTQAYDRDEANRTVQSWIGDQNLTSFAVDVAPDEVEVVLVGPDRPQGVVALADDLEAALGRDLDVRVRWIFEERFVFESDG